MERYRQALKKSYLPHIILIPVIVLVIIYCIIKLTSVGMDLETLYAECLIWVLLLSVAFLTWLNIFLYSKRLKKLKEVLPHIEDLLENCTISFYDTHFFLSEFFVTFEIPIAVRYDDIVIIRPKQVKRIQNHELTDFSYIKLELQSGKKLTIRKFAKKNIFGSKKSSMKKTGKYSMRLQSS
ncbi:MAG: hypothetical protein K6G33_00585 [Ruminococcus sp.]|uniref:hypothetical protein n=1 Tax=Ruminococcus sp. TaxID=41978 RepID=UPI0025D57FCC|nr:hypothetical protein [Ruminococcus sp.]MCR5599230.1 hypothetical protein [Ruminococcus sp.]